MSKAATIEPSEIEPPFFPATLHHAVFTGDLKTVKKCVEFGVSVNSQLGHSVPLVLSIAQKRCEISRYLVEQGADVNLGGKSGQLPLYLAAKGGTKETVELLLKAGAKIGLPHMSGNTPMLAAASSGHEEIVRMLLEAGSDPFTRNNSGTTGLHMAAYQRNTAILKMFLDAGLDVNMIQKRQGKKVLLSTEGHRGTTALHLAAMSPEQDETGRSFIPEVEETLRLLLDAGAQVNAVQENGRTPLHLAAAKDGVTTARTLIEHGAEIDAVSWDNEENKTPLHRAVDAGHVAMVTLLCDAGADMTSRDHWGVTALFTAVFSNNQPITRLLLQAGSDVNAATNNNSTPFLASLRHQPIITQMLLMSGCHGNLQDFLQNSPDYEATQEVRAWIIAFLENPKTLQQVCRDVVRKAVRERSNHLRNNLRNAQSGNEHKMRTDLRNAHVNERCAEQQNAPSINDNEMPTDLQAHGSLEKELQKAAKNVSLDKIPPTQVSDDNMETGDQAAQRDNESPWKQDNIETHPPHQRESCTPHEREPPPPAPRHERELPPPVHHQRDPRSPHLCDVITTLPVPPKLHDYLNLCELDSILL